ncbi:hypothetical protein GCM10010271_29570 [Streptomyces kurssanovii]|nr:hypothetical protein GCM10010271_29570 [Streptomyces kurssanovii]
MWGLHLIDAGLLRRGSNCLPRHDVLGDMTDPSPASALTSPPWPHCGHGAASETDPVGCRGVHVTGHTSCLVHLSSSDRASYFAGLQPGADLDHRGTPFTEDLLAQLLHALLEPATGRPRIGTARFEGASFTGVARFDEVSVSGVADFSNAGFTDTAVFSGATFSHVVSFGGARFNGAARFRGTRFNGDFLSGAARFGGARFDGTAEFTSARFTCDARFERATFTGPVRFTMVSFGSSARFDEATFTSHAYFGGATFFLDADFRRVTFPARAAFSEVTFTYDVVFSEARFEVEQHVGPLVCGGTVDLDGAVFRAPMTVEIAATKVSLRRARWESTAALRLRYAVVDLAGALLEYPLALAVEPAPFTHSMQRFMAEDVLAEQSPGVRISSVAGVDAAHLSLTDVDLSGCLFAGAVHLDQIRLDGRIRFARPPVGWDRRRLFLTRWSRPRTLAEEHHWRAAVCGQTANEGPLSDRFWRTGEHHPDVERTPGPEMLAALYRQLRKALEDSKNEPGAADFYYGESEMRRRDRDPDGSTPLPERLLLHLCWAVSGYGLRASRALAWLGSAMAATVVVMMLWGLPLDGSKPTSTGRQVEPGQQLVLTTPSEAHSRSLTVSSWPAYR